MWNRVTTGAAQSGHCWPLIGGQTYIQNLLSKLLRTPGREKTSRRFQRAPSRSEHNLKLHLSTFEVIGPWLTSGEGHCATCTGVHILHYIPKAMGSSSKLNLQRGRPQGAKIIYLKPVIPTSVIINLLVSVHVKHSVLENVEFKCASGR